MKEKNSVNQASAPKPVDLHGKTFSRTAFIAIIMIATFSGTLMGTSLGTAIPTLMKDFNINLAQAQEATSWFLMANGIMIPVSAFLANRFNTKALYIFAYALVVVGVFLSYIAPTDNWMIFLIGRIIAGISVGITMPLMQVVIVYLFPAEQRGAAMGLGGLVVGMGPAIGPTLSGWILDKPHNILGFTLGNSWREVILIPLIMIAVSSFLSIFFIKDIIPTKKVKLNFLSLIESTIGFGLFLWAMSNVSVVEYDGWADVWHVIVPGLVGILFIIIFVVHQLHMKIPFLNMRVFANKQFAVATALISLAMMAMMGVEMILPTYLQQIRGVSTFNSGLTILPGALLMGMMSPIAGAVYDRVGARRLVIVGFFILTVATVPFLFLDENTPNLFIVVMYAMRMFGVAIVMMPLTASAMSALPSSQATHATAANNTARQVASAVVVSLFTSVTQNIINTTKPPMSLKETNIIEFGQRTTDAALNGFHVSFIIALVIGVTGLALAPLLRHGKIIVDEQMESSTKNGGNQS